MKREESLRLRHLNGTEARAFLLFLGIGVLLAALPQAPEGDALYYLALARGEWVPAPYSQRVAVPMLASWLARDPQTGFLIATDLGLIGVAAATYFYLRALRFRSRAELGVLITCLSFYPCVFLLRNPYAVDPTFCALWVLGVWCIETDALLPFVLLLTVGVFVKEAILFLALGYAVRRMSLFPALAALPAVVVYLLRSGGHGADLWLPSSLLSGALLSFLPYVTWLVRGREHMRLALAGVVCVAPMVFLAHDTGRMLGYMLPFWLPCALSGVKVGRWLVGAVAVGAVAISVATLYDFPGETLLRIGGLSLVAVAPWFTEHHAECPGA